MTTCTTTRKLKWRLPTTWLALASAASILMAGAPARGQESGPTEPIIRIEEDWEMVLNEPDSAVEAPQFQTVMSPFPSLNSYYALVIWNYRELPEFAPGGLQLQSWYGDVRFRRRGVGESLLSTTAETITWTQAFWTDGWTLTFEIRDGHSVTWGDFGQGMQITQLADVRDLNGYTTATSVNNSWVTYGANRVNRLVITQVRRYGMSGLVSVDSTLYVVYEPEAEAAEGDGTVDPPIEGDDPLPPS